MAEQEFTTTESKNEGDKTIDTDQIETKHLSAVEDNDDDDDDQTKKKQKATTTPPDGYTCKLCGVAGHWIQQCDLKTKQKKRKRNLDGTSTPLVAMTMAVTKNITNTVLVLIHLRKISNVPKKCKN